MNQQTAFRKYARALRHFTSTRGLEVLALQASPILGCVLGGFSFARRDLIRFGLLLLGSLALTAHVFVLNDWAGHHTDIHDPRRARLLILRRGISSRRIARIAIALIILANVAFAGLGTSTILIGAVIAALSLLYSCSHAFGKSSPVFSSVNHLLGGTLHFLLGYTLSHVVDARGVMIGLFFGLVFAGGHLNQEVRDYESDLASDVRTNAVVFGCRRAFIASLCIFTAAYAALAILAGVGILPRLILCSAILWPLHLLWSLRALRRGLGFETALWMQRRYRLLFALIGLALLVR